MLCTDSIFVYSALLSIQPLEHALWLDGNFMNKYNRYHLQWVRSDWSVSSRAVMINILQKLEKKEKKNQRWCIYLTWLQNNVGVCTGELQGTHFFFFFSHKNVVFLKVRHESILCIQRSMCYTHSHLITLAVNTRNRSDPLRNGPSIWLQR